MNLGAFFFALIIALGYYFYTIRKERREHFDQAEKRKREGSQNKF
jgi:hypothetical protein